MINVATSALERAEATSVVAMLGSVPVDGVSPTMRRLQALIARIASTDRPVLVTGPTGAGKEIVAQQIHRLSPRRNSPFVDVNCSSIPESLIEAELFGHQKGAFTGAVSNHLGHFGQVGNGTLFLDEIGDLPLSLQPKLLRVIETRQFRCLGSGVTRHFEGRIVAATHRDLLRMVGEGSFREDLYYRLSVFSIDVPGLDKRREDVPVLAKHFASLQGRPLHFQEDALQLLMRCSWPGNVRQLRNLVDRVAVLADRECIDADTLAPFLGELQALDQTGLDEVVERLLRVEGENKISVVEHLLIDKVLRDCSGNKTAAARLLGVHRKVVERRVQAHGESLRTAEALAGRARTLLEGSDYNGAYKTLNAAMAVLRPLPPCPEERKLRFEVLKRLAMCKRTQEGWLSNAALEMHAEAIRVGRGVVDAEEINLLMFGTWTAHLMRLDLLHSRELAEEMRFRGMDAGDLNLQIDGCLALANTLFWLGEFETTLELIDELHRLPGFGVTPILRQGMDPAILASMIEGLAAYQRGDVARCQRGYEKLKQLCRQTKHSFSLAIGYQGCAWIACLLGDHQQTRQWSESLEAISREHGFHFYHGVGLVLAGYARSLSGDSEQSVVSTMKHGFEDEMCAQGGLLFHSFYCMLVARHHLAHHEFESARVQTEVAIRIAIEHREVAYLPELLCAHGRALLGLGDHGAAEEELKNALSAAAALGSAPGLNESSDVLASILKTSECIPIGGAVGMP